MAWESSTLLIPRPRVNVGSPKVPQVEHLNLTPLTGIPQQNNFQSQELFKFRLTNIQVAQGSLGEQYAQRRGSSTPKAGAAARGVGQGHTSRHHYQGHHGHRKVVQHSLDIRRRTASQIPTTCPARLKIRVQYMPIRHYKFSWVRSEFVWSMPTRISWLP